VPAPLFVGYSSTGSGLLVAYVADLKGLVDFPHGMGVMGWSLVQSIPFANTAS